MDTILNLNLLTSSLISSVAFRPLVCQIGQSVIFNFFIQVLRTQAECSHTYYHTLLTQVLAELVPPKPHDLGLHCLSDILL